MRSTRFGISTRGVLTGLVLFLAAGPLLSESPGKQHFEKSYPLRGEKDVKIGIKVGDATLDSFRIRNWPDAEDLEKGERDLNDKTTMVVELTYSNRDEERSYKCSVIVRVPGNGGEAWAENDRKTTLTKGKIGDTNKILLKMKTHHFNEAKKINFIFDIWRD
jgi:hypothetical protein